jgi:hypothetical protein
VLHRRGWNWNEGATLNKGLLAAPLLVAALVLAAAAPAHASTQPNIACGEVISHSVTLTSNLTCVGTAFSTTGIVPIVIDLAGHTVTTAASTPAGTISIGGRTTVENGQIGGPIVTDDFYAPPGSGEVYQNLTFDSGAFVTLNDTGPIIKGDRFINGASIVSDENSVDIENNQFVGTSQGTVAISLSLTKATVLNNTITGYRTGIQLSGAAVVNVQGNRISQVRGDGMQVGGFGGDVLTGTIANNTSSHNFGDGIVMADGSHALVTRNVTSGNSWDGIHLDAAQPSGNVMGLTATITGNTADFNTHLGIEAPPASANAPVVAVTDGGGNKAKGNSKAGQCTIVACQKG